MKVRIIVLLLLFAVFSSCDSGKKRQYINYSVENPGNLSVVVADTITYPVIVKNTDPNDMWREQCLSGFNRDVFVDVLFEAIYSGRLQAYDYSTEVPMSINEVKEVEKEDGFSRERIGNIQFVEGWYFDEEKLVFGKRVDAVMIAYEKFRDDGTVRYNPVFKVYLNN